jgi:hypothetical protein
MYKHTKQQGCGYCQLLTPEWEKVAGNMKNLVRVGAVDTERNPQVARNHEDSTNPIKVSIPRGCRAAHQRTWVQASTRTRIHAIGVITCTLTYSRGNPAAR